MRLLTRIVVPYFATNNTRSTRSIVGPTCHNMIIPDLAPPILGFQPSNSSCFGFATLKLIVSTPPTRATPPSIRLDFSNVEEADTGVCVSMYSPVFQRLGLACTKRQKFDDIALRGFSLQRLIGRIVCRFTGVLVSA